MNDGALLTGFVPVVSVLAGAGATYLWQVLGNRRADQAVRAQTNARLLELTSFVSAIYEVRHLKRELAPTLARLVTALDDMQIALAFRNNPDVLWKLGQIRVHCEMMMTQTVDEWAKKETDTSWMEDQRTAMQYGIGNILALTLDAMTDARMRQLAITVSGGYGFTTEAHEARVLAEQAKELHPG